SALSSWQSPTAVPAPSGAAACPHCPSSTPAAGVRTRVSRPRGASGAAMSRSSARDPSPTSPRIAPMLLLLRGLAGEARADLGVGDEAEALGQRPPEHPPQQGVANALVARMPVHHRERVLIQVAVHLLQHRLLGRAPRPVPFQERDGARPAQRDRDGPVPERAAGGGGARWLAAD